METAILIVWCCAIVALINSVIALVESVNATKTLEKILKIVEKHEDFYIKELRRNVNDV